MQQFLSRSSVPASRTDSKYVPMSGIDVTTGSDPKPLIGTSSLASCAGIAVYDRENQIGGVAHVFFIEKKSIVVYARDAMGWEIPSSGRSLIVNNPAPFAPFRYLTEALLQRAESVGGKQYEFYAFNVQHGCRTREQNAALQAVVEEVKAALEASGRINKFEYRHEQKFTLDTRTGEIRPHFP